MKRVVSLLLIAFFLFPVIGYHLFFMGLQYHAHQRMMRSLDMGHYTMEETMTLKIPIHLPYGQDQEFTRVDGDFEYKGSFYKLVKQKYERDTLHIVCIKDFEQKRLHNSMTELVKHSTDQPSSQKTMKLLNGFTKDYVGHSFFAIQPVQAGWSYDTEQSMNYDISLPAIILSVLSPPPDTLC